MVAPGWCYGQGSEMITVLFLVLQLLISSFHSHFLGDNVVGCTENSYHYDLSICLFLVVAVCSRPT